MLVASHKQIGNIVCDTLEQKFDIRLNRDSVLYGCELPDISAEYLLIPHFKRYSFKYILNLIHSLKKENIAVDEEKLKEFSLNLGIVLHYIADYFCSAHNHFKYNFFPLHIIYEYILSHKFTITPVDNIVELSDINFRYEHFINPNFFKNYINKKVSEYKALPLSPLKDIKYSIEACTSIAYGIVINCMRNQFPAEYSFEESPLEKAQ